MTFPEFVQDVTRTVGGILEGTEVDVILRELQPLTEAALQGDHQAFATLQWIANNTEQSLLRQYTAKALVRYVTLRRAAGTTATQVGVSLYPGQVNPLLLAGAALLGVILLRRR